MSRISESDLLLPTLYLISQTPGLNTTLIKNALISVFRPTGEDNKKLAGRPDTKFTQKVRNLLGSHYETNGMKKYTVKDTNGSFRITPHGQKLVDDNIEGLNYLFANSFPYEDAKTLSSSIFSQHQGTGSLYIYAEDDVVIEGKATVKRTIIKERSKKLREAALEYYKIDGHIKCNVCGFDFGEFYGALGIGYIQIHHEKPIYQTSDDGFSQYIGEAVRDMKPLCANCHCMVHRSKNKTLTLDELRQIISERKTSR